MEQPGTRGGLEAFSFYRAASPAERSQIAAAARRLNLVPGTVLFREGERCAHLVLVARGMVHTFKIAESGREIALFHVADGESGPVNTVSVLLDQPAIASARVDVPTEALLLPGALVRHWAARGHPIRDFLTASMASGLAEVMSLVEAVAFQSTDSRLADLLLRRFARRRVILATHEDLAAELGTAREVVSRLLKGFERSGAIEIFRGRLELRDESRLRRTA
jgi:CRP/FNR family transcriptional regulator